MAKGSLVQTLMDRMGPAAPQESGQARQGGSRQAMAAGGSGNEEGASFRAANVPSEVLHAARLLITPGPQGLRCEELLGPSLAVAMLQERGTFDAWVQAQDLTRHNHREATTLARVLELGVKEYGVEYLMSPPAEVLIRRLMAIALAHQQGSWRMATLLEEVPGPNLLSTLPESIISNLSHRMKLESKVEDMLKAEARKD